MSVSTVCIYCGSSNSVAEKFKTTARDASTALAQLGLKIVYGGGHVGLMGIIADAALKAGAPVTGIIPEHIRAQEVQHTGLTKLHVVPDMHTRKRMMVEASDAFLILPGGLGTLDEVFEILTWKKLKLHNKPIIIFNQDGYWDAFLDVIDTAIKEGFAAPSDRVLFKVVTTLPQLIDVIQENGTPVMATMTGRM